MNALDHNNVVIFDDRGLPSNLTEAFTEVLYERQERKR